MRRFRMAPAVRISIGLALFTMTLVLGAEMLGVFPDPHEATLDLRKKTCESLAVYASLAVQTNDMDAIRSTLKVLTKRNDDIDSAALRGSSGAIAVQVGDHFNNWNNTRDAASTPNNVQVPIFKGKQRWGTFEVSFKADKSSLMAYLWEKPVFKLLAILIPFAFLGYYLLMKKTLRHLDPSAVVPERVKLALDSLVEGVVLMDHHERIVLANKAFEENVGHVNRSLLGQKTSELDWLATGSGKALDDLPWRRAMREGASQAAVPLTLKCQQGDVRTFMVNGAPIVDSAGKTRGALATFDDVTQIEAQNTKLQKMLNALKRSRDEVSRQNRALQILATQDPLTGCFNRRAFFERFEVEFNRAQRYGNALSCVMVDIDHFKSINDNHGHPVGDKVIQKVSSVLRDGLRESDIICRYGGEEFCLILPETDLSGAVNTAERVRGAVAASAPLGIPVTISLGASAMCMKPADPSELLNQADRALYSAKTGGRNSTVTYAPTLDDQLEGDSGQIQPRAAEKRTAGAHIPHHVVKALMLALEHRDVPTAEHSRKVGDLCVTAAQGLMSINDCAVLEIAGQLHDIGKLGVPDSILLKPGPLTEEEWLVMRDHERRSVDVIASTFLSPELVDIVRCHSLWYDGSFTDDPDLPQGRDIPLGARILNIADAFHAMISDRPYRKARSYKEAYKELRRCAGRQFDPELVEHFVEVVKARDDSRRRRADGISNSVKLEIGREVEKLLIAVNSASREEISMAAEHLASRATKYGLEGITATAEAIEKAAAEKRNHVEIVELSSHLLRLCGLNDENFEKPATDRGKTLAA